MPAWLITELFRIALKWTAKNVAKTSMHANR